MDLLEGLDALLYALLGFLGSLLGLVSTLASLVFALAFIVGIPLVLLFYFLRNWIAAYDAREADKEEEFNKEFRKDPERAINRAPWKYESRADYDARMATMDAYYARQADKELRKDLESTTERRENHPEHDSTPSRPTTS